MDPFDLYSGMILDITSAIFNCCKHDLQAFLSSPPSASLKIVKAGGTWTEEKLPEWVNPPTGSTGLISAA